MNTPSANQRCDKCDGTGVVKVCCGRLVVGAEYMGAQEMICCGEPERDDCECMFADNPSVRREDIT